MLSLRSFLVTLVPVVVCYFFFLPPSRPSWLRPPMTKDTSVSPRSVAFGISLTASYGLVSVRYHDGSTKDIGRIDGGQKYLDMMRRFSFTSSSHPAYVSPKLNSFTYIDCNEQTALQ
jgi:hypothetical protein